MEHPARLPSILWHGPTLFGSTMPSHYRVCRVATAEPLSQATAYRNHFLMPLLDGLPEQPDLIVVQTGDYGLPLDVHLLPHPRLLILLDPENLWDWAQEYVMLFDAVATLQKRAAEEIRRRTARPVLWLPLYAVADTDPMPNWVPLSERPIDVAFVGHLDKPYQDRRREFIQAFQAELGHKFQCHMGPGQWTEIYSKSKITINHCMHREISFRPYEALLCGSVLVTPQIDNGEDDLFSPGVDTVLYREEDPSHAAHVVRGLLENPAQCEAIARAGWERVRREHLSMHREAQLLHFIENLLSQPRSSFPSNGDSDVVGMAQTLLWSAVSTGPVLPHDWRQRVWDRLSLTLEYTSGLTSNYSLYCRLRYLRGLSHLGMEKFELADACFAEAQADPTLSSDTRLADLKGRLGTGIVSREYVRSMLLEEALRLKT